MEQQKTEQAEALQFARVWKRVMPEGGPILPSIPAQEVKPAEARPETLPETGEEAPAARFRRAQIDAEQRICREGRQLWRRTGCPEFAACAKDAGARARRLAAGLYLLTGKWYLPAPESRPMPEGGRPGLRTLYCGLQALEQGYLAQAAQTEDGVEAALLQECARSCRRGGAGLRSLLERHGPV